MTSSGGRKRKHLGMMVTKILDESSTTTIPAGIHTATSSSYGKDTRGHHISAGRTVNAGQASQSSTQSTGCEQGPVRRRGISSQRRRRGKKLRFQAVAYELQDSRGGRHKQTTAGGGLRDHKTHGPREIFSLPTCSKLAEISCTPTYLPIYLALFIYLFLRAKRLTERQRPSPFASTYMDEVLSCSGLRGRTPRD